MGAHSKRDRLEPRGDDRRDEIASREHDREGAGPELEAINLSISVRDSSLHHRQSLQPFQLRQMNNQRVEAWSLLCLKNFYHRFGGKCVSRESVDCLRRQGDNFSLAQEGDRVRDRIGSFVRRARRLDLSFHFKRGFPARATRWPPPRRQFRRPRSGAPSCVRAAARACRKDEDAHSGLASAAAQFGSPRLQRSPSRLTIAVGRRSVVAPNGSPQTARTCCSNWLVTQPSIVQCPELCGRGASSLMINLPSPLRNISTARSPTSLSLTATAQASSRASLATRTPIRAGAMVRSRMPLRWIFSQTGKTAVAPSGPRATMTEISFLKSITRSRTHTSSARPSRWRRGRLPR